MKISFKFALGIAFVALTCIQARADTVLDQEYTANNGLRAQFSGFLSGFRRAETFTVGVAGTLTEIDIFISHSGDTFSGMNILSTVAGVPTNNVVATGSFQSTTGNVAVFTMSLLVTVGEVLAIEPFPTSTAST
jgi:hypothetical protein